MAALQHDVAKCSCTANIGSLLSRRRVLTPLAPPLARPARLRERMGRTRSQVRPPACTDARRDEGECLAAPPTRLGVIRRHSLFTLPPIIRARQG